MFFDKLRQNGVRSVIDTRIHRDGQLSAFAKIPDLPYFLRIIASIAYDAAPDFAPTESLLKRYRNKEMTWEAYAATYSALIRERHAERSLPLDRIDGACLLCSEPTATKCHRRLAAEYLCDVNGGDIEIVHL